MPSKKKKYNARFPSGRIKKIMQTDEEVGKVAQAVPVIISRTLELFVKSLLTKAMEITSARNAKTLTPSHMKQCILSESRFDFLKDLVKSLPDATSADGDDACNPINLSMQSSNNLSAASDSRRHGNHPGRTSTRPSTETQQSRPELLGNGTNPNFYIENSQACASFGSGSSNPLNQPTNLTIGTNEGSSDESDSDDNFNDATTPMLVPGTFLPAPPCPEVDEDYDT